MKPHLQALALMIARDKFLEIISKKYGSVIGSDDELDAILDNVETDTLIIKHFKKPQLTIGEIDDLAKWLNENSKEGYISEEFAEDLLESKNFEEIKRLRILADDFIN